MKNLFFIRSCSGIQSWEYYDCKTEALMFGDVAGYQYFTDCVKDAKNAKNSIHLDEIDISSNSMQVLITPVCKLRADLARLRLIERPTFRKESANMELIIFGTDAGYDHLIRLINTMMASDNKDLDEHVHLDDANDPCLVPRSVSLNIRSPLLTWTKESVGYWTDRIYRRQRDFLPEDIDYLFENPGPYLEPSSQLTEHYLQIRN